MTKKTPICCYHWRQQELVGNLGDSLVPILLEAMAFQAVPPGVQGKRVLNSGRCLLVIGSLLTETDLAAQHQPVDVWGCGWKGHRPSAEQLAKLKFYAVRGPQTAASLGLPADIPLGDPALLLPRLMPRPMRKHGRSIVVPHLHRLTTMSAAHRCQLSGCAELVGTHVLQKQGLGAPGWTRQLLGVCKHLASLGIQAHTPWGAVARIAGADFVLTGSLHGAILAQAYGVPWAAYDDGYIDAPAKWLDWGDYLGIPIEFVKNLNAGLDWWASVGSNGKVRDLDRLLESFPYSKDVAAAAAAT